MQRKLNHLPALFLLALPGGVAAGVVFETTTPYHHLLVVDGPRIRTLQFDHAPQTRMSLSDPLEGHFEYTEFFHMPWLWNDQIKSVLAIGLGGGSVQRAYHHYYPEVKMDTVELDSKVLQVARQFFGLPTDSNHKYIISDGRVFVRRSRDTYDLIILDAYTSSRYGSSIPYSLATKEFFALASDRLSENGILAYNVIGSLGTARRENIVRALHQTLNVVFPRVYLFPARRSQNVVLIATKSSEPMTLDALNKKADELIKEKKIRVPAFKSSLRSFRAALSPASASSTARVLTDDFAPVDGLLNVEP